MRSTIFKNDPHRQVYWQIVKKLFKNPKYLNEFNNFNLGLTETFQKIKKDLLWF